MANQWKPKRIRSEDERGVGSSDYIQLEEGQKFVGYALFKGDPAEDEPGYYEYSEHWVTGAKSRSVPCAGDNCPLCEDGDKPRDRAKTLWLVTQDAKGNKLDPPELRIFNVNSILIKQITEMRSEDETIYGQMFRVTRMDDRGNYVLQPKTGKSLAKTAIKEALKDPKAPDFDALVTAQLRKAMEGLQIARAMDDDDPEEEDEKPAKKAAGKKAKTEPEPDDDEWPDELEEVTVTVAKVEKEGNWIEATHETYEGKKKVWTKDGIEFDLTDLSKGDELVISADIDGDGEYILNDEPETPEEEPEAAKDDPDSDLPDLIEDENFVITELDAPETTIDVKSDDLGIEFTLYFLGKGPGSDVDMDDYEVGDIITVSAEKDSQGDMVATAVPEKVEEKKTAKKGGGKKASAKKGGKGKGK